MRGYRILSRCHVHISPDCGQDEHHDYDDNNNDKCFVTFLNHCALKAVRFVATEML